METKWTPGPWEIGEISSPPHDRGVFGPDAMVVAKIYVPLNFDKKQADANAKLIAKAPEMAETLLHCLAALKKLKQIPRASHSRKSEMASLQRKLFDAERILREAGAID